MFGTSPFQGKEGQRLGHPHSGGEMDKVWDIPTPGDRLTKFGTSPLQGREGQRLGHPYSRGEKDKVWDIPTQGERWERLGHPQALQIRYR